MPGLHSNNQQTEVAELVETPEAETKLFNINDVTLFPSGRHVWRQQGPYLVCNECPLQHASFIGMDREMIGEDEEGTPILREKTST